MRVLFLVLAWALLPPCASAQFGERARLPAQAAAKNHTPDGHFHATEFLMRIPAGQAAVDEYRAWKTQKAAGDVVSRKRDLAVGAREGFSVFNFNTESYEAIDFTLKKDLTRYTIWVETTLLDGTVSDAQIDALDLALGSETPAGSFDPNNGIIVNDEVIFGNPPDRDGDSKTDILLLDIRDNPDEGFFILGFFDPRDQGATGNMADIVYLDTDPGLNNPETILATAAHEYQHLIMWTYDTDETSFVSEAQSEWAEVMNGYFGRPMDFLSEDGEHEQDFFGYRDNVDGILDRERGQLFTLYLAEQLSPQTAGLVTQQSGNAQTGYAQAGVFGSVDAFEDFVVEFHVANLIGDTGVGSKYGYVNPFYDDVRTSPDLSFDGRLSNSLDETSLDMKGGSVYYLEFTDVEDFNLDIDVNPTNPSNIIPFRGKTAVRALVEEEGQPMVDQSITVDGTTHSFPGVYDRIRFVIANKRAQTPPPSPATIPVLLSADWGGETGSTIVSVSYDNGTASSDFYFTDGLDLQFTEFENPDPEDATLDRVAIAPYFQNQFSNGGQPPEAPRDVELMVLDGTDGFPDLTKEIFSLVVVDPRPFAGATTTLNHFEVDLSDHADQLANLPDVIYVGYGDTGTDENYTIIGPATNTTDNVSFFGRTTNQWDRLWNVDDPDTDCCNQRVFPIRANFLVAGVVDVEDEPALPVRATLSTGYPNPFSSEATIEFELPAAADVELDVFDILGRRVVTLADGTYPAGAHRVTLDGSRLPSGTYFYRMRTGDTETARSLIRL